MYQLLMKHCDNNFKLNSRPGGVSVRVLPERTGKLYIPKKIYYKEFAFAIAGAGKSEIWNRY